MKPRKLVQAGHRGGRGAVGTGPVYLSFDIDALDTAHAPGTGTPEIGGFTSREAQRILRDLRGLDFVGAALVEVSSPFDHAQVTALVVATLMCEILCLLLERVATKRDGRTRACARLVRD